jgi:indole-3-glycerol phosphate synthase
LSPEIPDILSRIVARKHEELRYESVLSPAELAEAASRRERRDFAGALRSRRPAVIAEIKKASPSRGILIERFNPAALAVEFQRGGAVALSVLTDHDFFHGAMADLHAARAACTLPVLRKDFTVHEYNVLEAAAEGADAVLLIAAILDEAQLKGFRELAADFGMAALVEVHDRAELDKAIQSGAEIVGVNNRDLRTFQVSLDVSCNLADQIPADVIKVSESGIFNSVDVHLLMDQGFGAFLVGEHLLKSGDPARALRELVS